MNKIYIILFTLHILSFTQADVTEYFNSLSQWNWINNKEMLIKYSQYRETVTQTANDQDNSYFYDCGERVTTEYREECEKSYAPLSDISKSYYQECAIPYYKKRIERSYKPRINCGTKIDACSQCASEEGKTKGCRSLEGENSLKQDEYNNFYQNLSTICEIDKKCPQSLGEYALGDCQTMEKQKCWIEWQQKNTPDDLCFISFLCEQQSVSKNNSDDSCKKTPDNSSVNPNDPNNPNDHNENSLSIIKTFQLFTLVFLLFM